MKLSPKFLGVSLAAALALPSPSFAAEMKLSLTEALKLARSGNYMIKAAKSRVDQAEGRIVQTRQSSLPKVTLSETVLVTNDPGAALVFKLQQKTLQNTDFDAAKMVDPGFVNDFNTSLQVMQPIYNADADKGKSMALKAKSAEELMATRTEETIGYQVSKIYYGMVLIKRNLEAVDQSISLMQGYSAEAVRGYNAGMLTRSDKLSTEVRLAELQEQRLVLQSEFRNAGDMMKVMLHLGSDVTIVPTDELTVDAEPTAMAELTAAPERTDLKAYDTWKEVAVLQGEMIDASRMLRVNAFLNTNLHSTDIIGGGGNLMLGLNVQWTIYDGMATAGRLQEAKAKEFEAYYSAEAAKRNSIAEVNRSLRSMRTAKSRITVANKALDAAKVSLDYIGRQYKTGMAMTFELLMREQAYTYSKMRLNQATYDYCVAKSDLEYYNGGAH